jgi:hypothetical protein
MGTTPGPSVCEYHMPVILRYLLVIAFWPGLWAATSASVSIGITNDDADAVVAAGVFRVLPPSGNPQDNWPSVPEGYGTHQVSLLVRRSGGTSGTVTVMYATSSSNATAGVDYLGATGVLTWANGDATDRLITVTLLGDTTPENSEYIDITLSNPSGGAIIGSPGGTIVLQNDDGPVPPVIGPGHIVASTGYEATYASEGDVGSTNAVVTFQRLNGSTGAVSVDYHMDGYGAVDGVDFVATTGTLTWPAGDASPKSVLVSVIGDTVWEQGDSVVVWLTNPTGGVTAVSGATLMIVDDDPATTIAGGILSCDARGYNVSEGDTGTSPMTCWVSRSGGSSGTVACSYTTVASTATAGVDFLATSGTLTWGPGDTAPKAITLSAIGDTAWENTEWFSLQLSAATGGATIAALPVLMPSFVGPVTITGYRGVAHRSYVQTVGPSRTYALTALPAGLSLNPFTGIITGTPTATGTTTAIVTATTELGTATTIVTFTITEPPVDGGTGSPADGSGGGGCGAGTLAGLLVAVGSLGFRRRRLGR